MLIAANDRFEVDFKNGLKIDFEKYKIKGTIPGFNVNGYDLKQWGE